MHLLEIDLLRGGEYTLAPLREKILEAGTYDYLVALSRSDDRTSSYIWRIQLSETLPHFTLPLRDEDETTIDLQTAFNQRYEGGGYRSELDYTQSPEPPLTREQEVWANALLIEKGVRSQL